MEVARGLPPSGAEKRFEFLCIQFSSTDVWPTNFHEFRTFLTNRRKSVCMPVRAAVKNFQNSCTGSKRSKYAIFRVDACKAERDNVQLKRHNFERKESHRARTGRQSTDSPTMCLLCVSFHASWRTIWNGCHATFYSYMTLNFDLGC